MKKTKTLWELNLENDFLFAKVMQDREICKTVLEKILNISIKEVSFPVSQKVIDITINVRKAHSFRCEMDSTKI